MIEQIKIRLSERTQGTWNNIHDAVECGDSYICQTFEGYALNTKDFENGPKNNEFIANAPQDIEYLITVIDQYKIEFDRMKQTLITIGNISRLKDGIWLKEINRHVDDALECFE